MEINSYLNNSHLQSCGEEQAAIAAKIKTKVKSIEAIDEIVVRKIMDCVDPLHPIELCLLLQKLDQFVEACEGVCSLVEDIEDAPIDELPYYTRRLRETQGMVRKLESAIDEILKISVREHFGRQLSDKRIVSQLLYVTAEQFLEIPNSNKNSELQTPAA